MPASCTWRVIRREVEDLGEVTGQVEMVVTGTPLGWEAEAIPKHLPGMDLG